MTRPRLRLLFFGLLALVTACSQSPSAPTPDANAVQEQVEAFGTDASAEIDAAIAEAVSSDGSVDAEALAARLEASTDARSVTVSDSGSTLLVEHENGLTSFVPLVRMHDGRMFSDASSSASALEAPSAGASPASDISGHEAPVAPAARPQSERAVILAPFDFQFDWDSSVVVGRLDSLGYSVDVHVDDAADLDKFRPAFLDDYGVVIISTHGAVAQTSAGRDATVLLTGEQVSASRSAELLAADEFRHVGLGASADDDSKELVNYYGVTPQWFDELGDGASGDAYFLLNACESMAVDHGEASMERALLAQGAGGVSGYDMVVEVFLAKQIMKKLVTEMSAGRSLSEATTAARQDPGLGVVSWRGRLRFWDFDLGIETLDYGQRESEPYYLTSSAERTSTPRLTPNSGPPGTAVVFQVDVTAALAGEVANVVLNIDNTGETIEGTPVDDDTWDFGALSAPTSDDYPRIDTFSYEAFDSGGSVLSSGAATFTITRPNAELRPASEGAGYGTRKR